jgi:hypothetical protein
MQTRSAAWRRSRSSAIRARVTRTVLSIVLSAKGKIGISHNWRSVKFSNHWEEDEEDGTKILHDRERFSHELTLVFAKWQDEDS